MTKIIEGDWIMEKDEVIKEDLIVKGNISGKDGIIYNLIVKGSLDCRNLDCRNLNCRNLNCMDLTCWDLNCRDLTCRDLKCWYLNCRDLNFYAVAFAYNNIKCKSIKGRRTKSKYFVLDGEIEIEKKEVCSECGREK